MCPKCNSDKVGSVCVDERHERPIWHFVCERCDMEWVE